MVIGNLFRASSVITPIEACPNRQALTTYLAAKPDIGLLIEQLAFF